MALWLPPVPELSIIGVADPGVPNNERIILRPTEPLNLARFCLVLGVRNPDGSTAPLPDHFLWLGELEVTVPSWIVIFTRAGVNQHRVAFPGLEGTSYVLHWGKSVTVLGGGGIVPSIFRIGGFLVGNPFPVPQTQLPLPK